MERIVVKLLKHVNIVVKLLIQQIILDGMEINVIIVLKFDALNWIQTSNPRDRNSMLYSFEL